MGVESGPQLDGTNETIKISDARGITEDMSDLQLYLAIGLPVVLNAAMLTVAVTAINKRLDDMRDLWRAELRRVEEVLDARLKHIEEERR